MPIDLFCNKHLERIKNNRCRGVTFVGENEDYLSPFQINSGLWGGCVVCNSYSSDTNPLVCVDWKFKDVPIRDE